MQEEQQRTTKSADVKVQRLGKNGYLHRVIPIVDSEGNVVQRVVKPLEVEFRLRDAFQTVLGAAILAIPAAYTEETWDLGDELGMLNILGIATLSLVFISTYIYYNFYKGYFSKYRGQYFIRVFFTYAIALTVVAVLLTLINQCPWGTDNLLAIKRIVVVAFPAALSATVADGLK